MLLNLMKQKSRKEVNVYGKMRTKQVRRRTNILKIKALQACALLLLNCITIHKNSKNKIMIKVTKGQM